MMMMWREGTPDVVHLQYILYLLDATAHGVELLLAQAAQGAPKGGKVGDHVVGPFAGGQLGDADDRRVQRRRLT